MIDHLRVMWIWGKSATWDQLHCRPCAFCARRAWCSRYSTFMILYVCWLGVKHCRKPNSPFPSVVCNSKWFKHVQTIPRHHTGYTSAYSIIQYHAIEGQFDIVWSCQALAQLEVGEYAVLAFGSALGLSCSDAFAFVVAYGWFFVTLYVRKTEKASHLRHLYSLVIFCNEIPASSFRTFQVCSVSHFQPRSRPHLEFFFRLVQGGLVFRAQNIMHETWNLNATRWGCWFIVLHFILNLGSMLNCILLWGSRMPTVSIGRKLDRYCASMPDMLRCRACFGTRFGSFYGIYKDICIYKY